MPGMISLFVSYPKCMVVVIPWILTIRESYTKRMDVDIPRNIKIIYRKPKSKEVFFGL